MFYEDLPVSTQVPTAEKRAHFSRILRNPFSLVWSKLATLFQVAKTASESEVTEVTENSQSEQQEPESIREQHLDTCFTDRVDPSLYYKIRRSHFINAIALVFTHKSN